MPDVATALDACFVSKRLWTGCSPVLNVALGNTVSAPGFKQLATIAEPGSTQAADARVLAQLVSGWRGVVVPALAPAGPGLSPADSTINAAFLFFRGIGNLGLTAPTDFMTTASLRVAAASTAAAGLEARQALEGLSNFVVSGSTSPAPSPELANLTAAYLDDRAGMLEARNRFDSSGLIYGVDTASGFSRVASTTFLDLSSGVRLALVNSFGFSTPRSVQFGSTGADVFTGTAGDDRFYGGVGADTLIGAGGDDYLEGGLGNDRYEIGAGRDTLRDADGLGLIVFNGVTLGAFERLGTDLWRTADQRFTLARNLVAGTTQLLIVDTSTGTLGFGQDRVEVQNFALGQLGLTLADAGNAQPATQTTAPSDISVNGFRDLYEPMSPLSDRVNAGRQYDNIAPSNGADVVFGDAGGDRLLGGNDGDSLFGEADNDFLRGGAETDANPAVIAADTDTVAGGTGLDLVAGGMGNDVLYAGTPLDPIDSGGAEAQGDWLLGGTGDDLLYGSAERDFLNGGAGRDTVQGGAGADLILGDGAFDFQLAPSPFCFDNTTGAGIAANHRWNGSAWITVFPFQLPPGEQICVGLTPLSHVQWSYSLSGDDFNFVPVAARPAGQNVRVAPGGAQDLLRGGPGDDAIYGQAGADLIYGDAGADRLIGDDVVALANGAPGDDQLFGGDGNDRLLGNAGSDTLSGDDGDDTLLGDDAADAIGAPDTLYGGPGADTLDGGAGPDVVSGDEGNDPSLVGGAGDDLVLGGEGNDVLRGDGSALPAGADVLDGGAGDDQLFGDGGADTLSGGPGADIVDGGDGADLLVLSDALDTLRGGAGDDVFRVGLIETGISGATLARIEDSSGSDRIRFDSLTYRALVRAEVDGSDLIVRLLGPAAVRVVNGASGGVIEQYEFADGQVYTHAQIVAGPEIERALAAISTGNDYQVGTAGNDAFDLLAGDDVGLGEGGNDTLNGNQGEDILDGGDGNDTLGGDEQNDRLHGSAGDDILRGGTGDDQLFGGDGNDQLQGGADADMLYGHAGADTIDGDAGDDLLSGGPGNDTLRGGAGLDTYVLMINDDTVAGSSIIDSAPNAIRFDPAIRAADVSLTVAGVDLIVNYRGSSIRIVGGAAGGSLNSVISTLQFGNQPPVPIDGFVARIFADGFEQP